MQVRYLYVGTVAFLLSTGNLFAQLDISINSKNFNGKFLSQLIAKGADSIRLILKLTSYERHGKLMEMAQQQAELFASRHATIPIYKKLLSENMKFNDLRENKLETLFTEQLSNFPPIPSYLYRNVSYKQTARNIARQWLATSKRELQSSKLNQIGVGASIDTVQNKLIAVIIVADGLNSLAFNPNDGIVSGTEFYPSNEKRKIWFKRSQSRNRNLLLAQRWRSRSQEYTGWISVDRRRLKRTFHWYHFRGGLVQESVAAENFNNEFNFLRTPTRINQRSLLDGEIHPKISRRELVRLSKVDKEDVLIFGVRLPFKKWKRYVSFPAPILHEQNSSPNLLVIRKGKLCDIILHRPIPGKELVPKFPKLDHRLLGFEKSPDTIKQTALDSTTYRINYKRNITTLTDEDEDGLLSMVPASFKISKIRIRSFASIEGNSNQNQQLFLERAEKIKSFLNANDLLTNDVTLDLKTNENWDKMKIQIRERKNRLGFTGNETSEQIRNHINRHVGKAWIDSLLNDQRYSVVSFELTKVKANIESPNDVLQIYNKLIEGGKFTSQTVQRLLVLQKKYYSLLTGTQQATDNKLHVPNGSLFAPLVFQEAKFKYLYLSGDENEFRQRLKSFAGMPEINGPIRTECLIHHQLFLANALFYSKRDSIKSEDWDCPIEKSQTIYLSKPKKHKHNLSERPTEVEALDLIPVIVKNLQLKKASVSVIRDLRLYFYVTKAQLLLAERKYFYLPEIKALSTYVWLNLVKNQKLSDLEAIDFALFFNLTFNEKYSKELLEPLVNRAEPHPEALMISISLSYDESNEAGTEEALIKAQKFLTRNQWIELAGSGSFLPVSILERSKVREIWQEQINKIELSE